MSSPLVIKEDTSSQRNIFSSKTGGIFSRSGQRDTDAFLDSVLSAYSNFVYSPVLLCLYLVNVISLLALNFQISTVYDFLLSELRSLRNDTSNTALLAIIDAFIKLFDKVIHYQYYIIVISLFLIPYLIKPSRKNLYFIILFACVSFLFRKYGLFFFLGLSQYVYLYFSLRNPHYKFFLTIILFLYVAIFYLESANVQARETPTQTPTVPTPTSTYRPKSSS